MKKLKQAITHIWRFLLGIILLVLAIFLLTLVTVVSVLVYLCSLPFEKKTAREILTESGSFNKMVSVGIDILGNIVGMKTFNKLFLKETSQFLFGVAGQRISSVLHWNYLLSNLSRYGLWLYNLLEWIEKDHGEKSVAVELLLAENLLKLNNQLKTTYNESTIPPIVFLAYHNCKPPGTGTGTDPS